MKRMDTAEAYIPLISRLISTRFSKRAVVNFVF